MDGTMFLSGLGDQNFGEKGLRDQNNGKKIGISGSRIYHVTTLPEQIQAATDSNFATITKNTDREGYELITLPILRIINEQWPG